MTHGSERGSLDKAVSRYSQLFTIPSDRDIVISLCILCIIAGIIAVFPFDLSSYGLSFGLFLGVFLLLATLFVNYLTVNFLLKKDLIFDLRRCSFLSFSSNLILLTFTFVANLTSAPFSDPKLWVKVVSLGFFASLSIRFLVFYSLSFVSPWKIFFSVLLQPVLFLVPLSTMPLSFLGFQNYYLLYFFLASFAAFFGVYLFITSLNTVGMKAFGIPSIKLLKAFLVNWIEDLEKPFEEILEQLSEERDVNVSLLAFKSEKRLKAVIVVPNLHPGPFKNVGSSTIPSLIQESLEKKMRCVVSVPHGISGHELDLASHVQNRKVLNRTLEAAEFNIFNPYATSFLSLKKEDASIGCQIFGDCALLTLTLAPKTMEDLPLELNDIVIQEARRKGFTWAVAIDAHNSIEGPFNPDKAIDPIKKAVTAVLEEAVVCERSQFEVGAAKVIPKEFGVEEGMGPGGISVIIIKVSDQKTAYVTIDGNNMVPNLREKILSSLQELGVSNGEILTTDTHIVSGVVKADRGYYPIGEIIDHNKLIEYIKMATMEALKNLEPAETSWRREDIRVKIIGERQIDNLCLLVDKAAKKAKRSSAFIFPTLSLFLILLLVLI